MTASRLFAQGIYLDLRLNHKLPAQVATAELMNRWGCDQSTVSRRLQALDREGLACVCRGRDRGTYWIDPVMLGALRRW